MLLIEHFVAPSPVHGLGVFSSGFVPTNTKVWIFHPAIDREIPASDLHELPAHVAALIERHAEYLPQRNIFRLSADGDYYLNHSDNPNLENRDDDVFSCRDIRPGEELFCDYNTIKVLAFNPNTALVERKMSGVADR